MKKEQLTKEVLDTLIGTASFGSPWLFLQFDNTQVPAIEGEMPEETAVRILLAGGKIEFIDDWAEDAADVYSDTGYWEQDAAIYPVTLEDIRAGLERVENGTWKFFDKEQKELVESDVTELLQGEDACFDIDEAERVCQVIMFNEIVY